MTFMQLDVPLEATSPRCMIVTAPPQFGAGGIWMSFQGWQDGVGAANRTIVTPATSTTYTAVFQNGATVALPLVVR